VSGEISETEILCTRQISVGLGTYFIVYYTVYSSGVVRSGQVQSLVY